MQIRLLHKHYIWTAKLLSPEQAFLSYIQCLHTLDMEFNAGPCIIHLRVKIPTYLRSLMTQIPSKSITKAAQKQSNHTQHQHQHDIGIILSRAREQIFQII